ncbi:sensor domain-containing diguanylate cyclase [Sulfobacillus harzensis]|uniref:GGDEF domain-containing protein n=1 Tax=Sulfobacillus harzensis TaxID=2729629 RepID=UPI001FACE895|nr:sensor domain-containing diguanylate cyclase [Sulfobacillus harzensis]
MWKPASAYTFNRGRFHNLVFGLRGLLWLVAAVFAWGHPFGVIPLVLWLLLMAFGAFIWRRPNWLEVSNQLLIVVDLVLLSIAISMTGGIHSPVYLLYGGEALFLTVYGTLRYSSAGALAVILAYGFSTGAWDLKIFWWRMAIMAIYLFAAGGLGREYRLTRYRNRENYQKLDQISRLKVLQESIMQEQDINIVLMRLLEESRSMSRADAAYLVRVDAQRRISGFTIQGVATPELTIEPPEHVPSSLEILTPAEEAWNAWPLHHYLYELGMRSLILVPLHYEESFYGWMGLSFVSPEVNDTQSFIVQNLADVMSMQLRFDESQSVASKRGQLLAILERMGRIVNRNLEMEQLFRSLRKAVADVLENDSFFVALTLPDDPAHCLMQYLWDDGEEYPPEIFPVEPNGLTGSVIISGKPSLINGRKQVGTLTGSYKEPLGMLVVPLIHEGRVLGAMSVQSYRIEYDPDHLEFLSAIASQASIAIRNAQMYQQTQEIALTDYLTGLGNSRRFNLVVQSAVEMAEETGQPLSLLLIDSDSLKSINDRFGHRAGDLHLQRVAQVIRENIREDDVACRYAGDEFVVVLPKSHLDDALQVGERIRHEIETHQFEWSDTLILGSTISVGAAQFQAGMTVDALFQAADRAMYNAKQGGKNRVAAAR